MKKHKVKLVKVYDDSFDLKIDGAMCRYLIQRPQPLGLPDANMLRNVMDTRLLESMLSSAYIIQRESLYQKFRRFIDSWRHRGRVPLLSCDIADFIKNVGVEVNIDKKTKGIVILKSDLDKIRKGST